MYLLTIHEVMEPLPFVEKLFSSEKRALDAIEDYKDDIALFYGIDKNALTATIKEIKR